MTTAFGAILEALWAQAGLEPGREADPRPAFGRPQVGQSASRTVKKGARGARKIQRRTTGKKTRKNTVTRAFGAQAGHRGGTSGEAPPGEGVPAERAAGAPQARLRRALPSGGGFVQACGGRSNPEVPPLAGEVPPEVPPQGTSLPFCRFSLQTGPTPPRTLPLSSQSASRTAKKRSQRAIRGGS